MHDPFVQASFDSNAFPPALRAASFVLSALLIGALLFEAFTQTALLAA